MKRIENEKLSGERALFQERNCEISRSLFFDGESPLKHSSDIMLKECTFDWKYPLWYSERITVKNCRLTPTARAGVWYTKDMKMTDTIIDAPKTFRRCHTLELENVQITDAAETLWNCNNVQLSNVTAKGDYFSMNSENMVIRNLHLDGNYPFDGGKNIEVHSSKLLSKDAFWNAKNVTVYDSEIRGEYLGWNSENLTFINCTIESLQGMCYINNLKLKNCKLKNTTLAFEYSSVDADISSGIDSVLNPKSGTIKADYIKDLILEKDQTEPSKVKVIVKEEK